ncbi:MAG TPA: HAMP domain-containing histidine kinase [Anaerolineae bacterium]|nr:HAMP domain-containing histidine kinase [Anaerolineae bacterium]HID83682.1 HAMP domain-containing histidine kinase [Anaerolineales bacterium]
MPSRIHRKLAYLVQASIALNSASDPQALLRYLLRVATEVLECEGASILLYDERQRQLFFVAATGAHSLERVAVPLDRSIAGEVFRKGEPLVVHHAERDPRHFSRVGRQVGMQVRTLLAVPLMARGRKVGVLEALNKTQGAFGAEEVRLARILAAQAGVAIHNARVMEDMRRAYASLAQAKRVQEEMLALASHELRTPLGIILGYAAILQQEARGDQAEFARAVVDAAMKMRAIVDEMRHFVEVRQGKAAFCQEVFPLQQVLRQAVDAVRAAMQEKKLRLETRWPQKERLWVRGDPEKLHQALAHLLDNALRFTPQGGRVRVLAWREGSEVFARVEDSGVGIPPEELEAIFEEFHQVEGHLTRRYGGLGLGLSIARNLVRLHGGRIWAESEGPGRGARFTIALPAVVPPQEEGKN